MLAKIRLGWRELPATNTLAYFASLLVTKKFNNRDSSVRCYKTFRVVICKCSYKARVFVPGKPFQPSLRFVSNIRLGSKGLPGTNILAYFLSVGEQSCQELTQVKYLSGAPLKVRLLALPTNIRISWKGHGKTF